MYRGGASAHRAARGGCGDDCVSVRDGVRIAERRSGAAEALSQTHALVLSEGEQRELLRLVIRLDAGLRHWEALLPGMALSMDEALGILVRVGIGQAGEADRGA